MSDTKRFRTINIIALLAIFISIGALLFSATPCNIAHGQTICDIGDVETISEDLTLSGAVLVGATPNAGTSGQFLTSSGAVNSPEWITLDNTSTVTFKAIDQTLTTDTVLQDDDDFTFAVDANSKYLLDIFLVFDSPSAADFKHSFTEPVASTISGYGLFTTQSNLENITAVTTNDIATTSATQVYRITIIIDTAATAGNVVLQWAQLASSGTTTVQESSFAKLIKFD